MNERAGMAEDDTLPPFVEGRTVLLIEDDCRIADEFVGELTGRGFNVHH